ncbi:alpha-tubulin N-acetyltransferase 1 isoform X2 [Rhipicephalus microplus]|uniref:alpha-tubulin N-acetyltransferase 1 isoform X2 n=1 Tax=Rhipicephalus microplus TaxID=6941 RepID=UPI001887E262|nr:alpha-tubulin N-acetyltransferase 1-like isoform X2 [Rhipicephalus microplus]
MEFPFGLDFLEYEFNVIENDLKVRDASKVGPLRDLPHDEQHRFVRSSSRVQERLGLVIDALGKASSLAQSLAAPVTTSDRLRNSDHRVYLLVEPSARGGTVLGLLKVGFKQLFLRDGHGRLCQVRPLCLLDFYVHQSRQRKGNGRRLFDRMTQTEKIAANQIAIDQPSEKMLAFMERHFNLTHPLPQSNHFAVFPGFFQASPEQPRPLEQVSCEKSNEATRPTKDFITKPLRSVLEYDVHTHWIHLWLAAAWTGLVMTNLLSQQLDLGRSIGAVSHRAAHPKAEVCGQPPGSSYSHAARPSAPARGGSSACHRPTTAEPAGTEPSPIYLFAYVINSPL